MAHDRRSAQGWRGLLTSCTKPSDTTSLPEPSPRRRRLLLLILALTLVRGVAYLVLFPPWQHYDEPTHFEYVRLIAERGRLPEREDYDLTMRREIASSMQAADFWKGLPTPALDFWSDKPPDIGLSELHHPPLYYVLLALPQRLVAHQSVETQLYLARAVSVLLYVAIVTSAYGLVAELFPKRQWLPAAVASIIAFLPPVTDLMTAVNNDVGAAAATSMLLWSVVRLVRLGPSPGRVAVTLVLAGACFATKMTASLVAAVVLLTLTISLVPQRYRRWIWAGLALMLVVTSIAGFRWGRQAARWYSNDQPAATNRVHTQAPHGQWALVLSADRQDHPRTIFQELSREAGQALQGHTVTLGAWVIATKGQGGNVILNLSDGTTDQRRQIHATEEWQFHAFTATVGIDAPGVSVSVILPAGVQGAQEVYVDSVVLIDGPTPTTLPPQFETDQASLGQWGGQPITNLLSNGSAERSWPSLWPGLAELSVYRFPATQVLHSILDWTRTAWVYGPELWILLQSFWGRFGWNHVALPTAYFYPLALATIAGLLGAGIGLFRRIRAGGTGEMWQRDAWLILGVALVAGWGATIIRTHPLFITQHLFWPVARYATVVIVPTTTLLCIGWSEIVPRRWNREAAWLGLLALMALDAVAAWTAILPYYYS